MDQFEQLEQWFPDNSLYDYGELSGILPQYVYAVLKLKQQQVFTDGSNLENITMLEYWFVLSLLCQYDYVEYGSSPRGAWLTDKGTELLLELEKEFGNE